jgi:outer membrane protein OmpA-like peptidoglycan-associated protein
MNANKEKEMRSAARYLGATKKLALLAVLLGLTASGAFGQKEPTRADEEVSVTVTEGEIRYPLKGSDLRIYIDMMVSGRCLVYFHQNSSSISAKAQKALEQLAKYLNQNPELKIKLKGNSDTLGKEKVNCAIAVKRVENMMNYLSAQGVSPNRMRAYGSCGQFEKEKSPAGPN